MKRVWGIVASVVLTAACSSSNKPAVTVQSGGVATTTTAAVTTSTVSDAVKNAELWVKAAVATSPKTTKVGIDLSVPGSPAHAYMVYENAQAKANQQKGQPTSDFTTEVQSDGSIKACATSQGKEHCVTFSDFVADASGLISDAHVEGNDLQGRAREGASDPLPFAGGTVQFLAMIQGNTADSVLLAVQFAAGEAGMSVFGYSDVKYISPDGTQTSANSSESTVTTDVAANATSVSSFAFDGATIGGRLSIRGCPSGNFANCQTVQLDLT
jgi:hypothetical protein